MNIQMGRESKSENDKSKIQAEIGAKWEAKASLAGRAYKYYVVFKRKTLIMTVLVLMRSLWKL